MLSVMLYFSGSHMPQKGDYAPAHATFRCLCHILCSDFGVKYALKRRLCYCCTAVCRGIPAERHPSTAIICIVTLCGLSVLPYTPPWVSEKSLNRARDNCEREASVESARDKVQTKHINTPHKTLAGSTQAFERQQECTVQ